MHPNFVRAVLYLLATQTKRLIKAMTCGNRWSEAYLLIEDQGVLESLDRFRATTTTAYDPSVHTIHTSLGRTSMPEFLDGR